MTPSLVPPNTRYFESFNESHREWAGAYQDGASLWLAADLGLDLSRPDDFDVWVETLLVEPTQAIRCRRGASRRPPCGSSRTGTISGPSIFGTTSTTSCARSAAISVMGFGPAPGVGGWHGWRSMQHWRARPDSALTGSWSPAASTTRAPAARSRPLGAYSKTSDHPPSPIVSRDSIWSCASLLDRHTALTPARSG